MSELVIEVGDLVVDYGKGARSVRAVRGVSFEVKAGECVGFIGANGAGKSTTMKALMGFLFPTSGTVEVFGSEAGTARSRQRTGYLPEVALYYPFMKARELLELYGGLQGMSRRELKARIPGLLETVGLGGRGETLLRDFSKGMQQRVGIAQSLIANPELLIFDELSSGLDPLGRFDLRRILMDLKREGRTVFFSSHELSEVESLCDRILIVHEGRVIRSASLAELMKPLNRYEICFSANGGGIPESVRVREPVREADGTFRLEVEDVEAYAASLTELSAHRCGILKASSRSTSLEDYFIGLIRDRGQAS
jgi:ABC-2 type transport system ATP-binding protein